MTKITFNGKDYNCLTTIEEIKKVGGAFLFGKYATKQAMFEDLVGKCKDGYEKTNLNFDDDEDVADTYAESIDDLTNCVWSESLIDTIQADFGKCCGQLIYSGSTCYCIELYKIEDLDSNSDLFYDTDFYLCYDNFFVKDDNGQVYFVYTNED